MIFTGRGIFCFFLLVLSCTLQAQRFGGNPPSVRWQQVNNPVAKVIYPQGLDSVAMQVAGIVQRISETTQPSIGTLRRTVPIVLHNQTTQANGYVGLGPFRSEFYLTPEQNSFNIGSLPWYEQLAIHEYRHVQQYNNFNVGLSKAMRTVFGEEGQALANSLVIPDWFFEGDAVYNETNVSRQGRGRMPFFFNDYRSLWTAGKQYSWMKLRNGSYRDFVPDHYRLGYMLAAYGREKYGDDFWKKVTKDAAAFKGLLYPLQKAVQKYSGVSYAQFRRDALSYFQASTNATAQVDTMAGKHFVADEEFPVFTGDSGLVFLRTSYRQIPTFVWRHGNKDRKIRVRAISIDSYFSYRNGRIVYSAYRPDLRWSWREWSDLQVLDLQTGRERTLTRHTRLFSPDISEDGKTVVAVQVAPDGSSHLQLLDGATGAVTSTLPNPGDLFWTYPRFADAGRVVSAVRNSTGLMTLALTDLATGTTRSLLPFSRAVIGFPVVQGDTVYFTASYQQYDRLFAFTLSMGKLFLLQHPLLQTVTGKYAPSVNSQQLAWSDFTATGYRVRQVPKGEIRWQEVNTGSFGSDAPDFGIAAVERNPAGSFGVSRNMKVDKYAKSTRLLNFHSLEPLVDDPDYTLTLVGENVLNSLQSELSAAYNRNEQFKRVGFAATYGGWFPYLTAGITETFDRRALYKGKRVYWNESELRGGFSLPFNLSKGRTSSSLRVGSQLVSSWANFKGTYKDTFALRPLGYVSSSLQFTRQSQQVRQQIYPRFAQTLSLSLRNAVWNYTANQFLASGAIYLPGAFLTHSLVLSGAFQQRDTLQQRQFSNSFPFSRGYTAENLHRMYKWSVNYHLPLFYPDAGVGNIAYLLRVRANFFFDQTYLHDYYLNGRPFYATLRSAGTEVFFDSRWWNQLPVNFGFRYSRLLDRDRFGGPSHNRFELILPVNLLDR